MFAPFALSRDPFAFPVVATRGARGWKRIPRTIAAFPRRREHAGERRRLSRPCRNRCAGTPDSATVAATVRSEYWGMGAISCRLMSERVERTRGRRARDTSFPEQCKASSVSPTPLREVTSAAAAACQEIPSIFGPSFPKGRRLASASGWRQGRRQARHHSGERLAEARALIHRNGRRAP